MSIGPRAGPSIRATAFLLAILTCLGRDTAGTRQDPPLPATARNGPENRTIRPRATTLSPKTSGRSNRRCINP